MIKIGFYPMVADVLHTGHIMAIAEAKQHCDYLIIGLHCCPNYKNPVQTIFERFTQLEALSDVDKVIPYQNVNDVKNIITSLKFDVFFLGEDHKGENWEGRKEVEDMQKEIYYLSRKHGFSSTDLKKRIIDRSNEENKVC